MQSTDKVFLRKARRTREETESLHAGAGGDLGEMWISDSSEFKLAVHSDLLECCLEKNSEL